MMTGNGLANNSLDEMKARVDAERRGVDFRGRCEEDGWDGLDGLDEVGWVRRV